MLSRDTGAHSSRLVGSVTDAGRSRCNASSAARRPVASAPWTHSAPPSVAVASPAQKSGGVGAARSARKCAPPTGSTLTAPRAQGSAGQSATSRLSSSERTSVSGNISASTWSRSVAARSGCPVTARADPAPRNATRVGGPGRSQNDTRKPKNGESGARKLGTVPVRASQNGRRNSAISLTMAPLRRPPMAALFRSGRSGRKAIALDWRTPTGRVTTAVRPSNVRPSACAATPAADQSRAVTGDASRMRSANGRLSAPQSSA